MNNLPMSEKDIVNAIEGASSSSFEVDKACCDRISRIAANYGEDGKIAKDLLAIVMRLLDISY